MKRKAPVPTASPLSTATGRMTTAKTPVQTDTPTIKKATNVPSTRGKVKGFLTFGSDNLFPQKLVHAVSQSVTAGACVRVRSRFIQANGFLNSQLSKVVVNASGLTADKLLAAIAWNVSMGEVVSLHVGYNGLGQTCSVRPISFPIIRSGEPDDSNTVNKMAVFPYLDSTLWKTKAEKHTALDLFNPDPDVVLSQMAAAGGSTSIMVRSFMNR